MIKILIVENLEKLSAIYKENILCAFYGQVTVDMATNSTEALEKVRQGVVYDIIVIDMQMSLISGIALGQGLRRSGFSNLLIAHTALGIQEAKEAMIKGQMNGFSLKSSTGKGLLKILQYYRGSYTPPQALAA